MLDGLARRWLPPATEALKVYLQGQAHTSPDSATYNALPLRPEIFWSIPMKPVILCVDDTPSVLEGQKMLLEENGYRVLTATNGKEAV